tara:strand:+ start:56 stop:2071 length:2016 start_codon:yes stop_codon:yes gene_type:complete
MFVDMEDDLFFNGIVTKALHPIQGTDRFFEGYLTVQVKDKQGEITIVDELIKVLPIWMDRGAPITDTHSNRVIGKGINYSQTVYKTNDGVEYPAIKITGKIHKNYELDDEIWKKIRKGEYKGLSFGGATKSDRDPITMKDGSIAYSLKDLEHYEVAVCADPAVPLALITDFNPVAKSMAGHTEERGDKMVIKCGKFGCYIKKGKVNGNYMFEGKKVGTVKDVDIDKWYGHVTLDSMPDFAEYGGLDQGAEIHTEDGTVHRPPNPERGSLLGDVVGGAGNKGGRQGGEGAEHDVDEIDESKKADNITKPIPDGKGGKGDFAHCESKNQDKDDPSAFCGAIQHKLEKAVREGRLDSIEKYGLEMFATKEELNKVCGACGKTLAEHGIVKYDHSNTQGDQHSMYNQNTGRETWVGQGLPQPTVEGKDDNPTEKDKTINADARQASKSEDEEKREDIFPESEDSPYQPHPKASKEQWEEEQQALYDLGSNPETRHIADEHLATSHVKDPMKRVAEQRVVPTVDPYSEQREHMLDVSDFGIDQGNKVMREGGNNREAVRVADRGTISEKEAEKLKSDIKLLKLKVTILTTKTEENMIGAGQRGLGFDHGSVQGSGQSHQITEVKDDDEATKSGYVTEAGNKQTGDSDRGDKSDKKTLIRVLSPFGKKEVVPSTSDQ